jgi:triphosphatase
MPQELEIKLLVARAKVRALRLHPLLRRTAAGAAKKVRVESVYYDTEDWDLRAANVSVRRRHIGARWVQTVKGGGGSTGGLHIRDEWESSAPRTGIDLSRLETAFLPPLLRDPDKVSRLQPVFETRFIRTVWLLDLGAGTHVEAALDLGEIVAGSRREPIGEFELELKSGGLAPLLDCARLLQRELQLSVGNQSKAERGYALIKPVTPAVVHAAAATIKADQSVEAAFASVVRACVSHLQANEAGVRQGTDPESVHQARVALRRLLSAFTVFGRAIPKPAWDDLKREVKWIGGVLGSARDWEVLATQTLTLVPAEVLPPLPRAALVAALERRIRNARGRARAALDASRYAALQLQLARFVECSIWRTVLTEEQLFGLAAPIVPFAAAELSRRHQHVTRVEGELTAVSDDERHAVRIAAKKLRYAAEFFGPLFSPKRGEIYVRSLRKLQDVLGVLNDLSVAADRLAQLARLAKEDAPLLQACTATQAFLLTQQTGLIGELGPAWERFLASPRPWKKLARDDAGGAPS